MAENQVYSTTSEKKQSEETCPSCPPYAPKPDCEVPNLPPENIYDRIKDNRDEIDAALKTAERAAEDKHAESIQKAKDTKAEAESKHELAKAKYGRGSLTLFCHFRRRQSPQPLYTGRLTGLTLFGIFD